MPWIQADHDLGIVSIQLTFKMFIDNIIISNPSAELFVITWRENISQV